MLEDLYIIQDSLSGFECCVEGVNGVLELKEVDYNWKQMEWWAFYFEYKVKNKMSHVFKINKVPFDMQNNINWDIKASVCDGLTGRVLLNDIEATNLSVKTNKFHGNLIGFFEPLYDITGDFKNWHDSLKGKKSKYVIDREKRTTNTRIRKTKVRLNKFMILVYDEETLKHLDIVNQGLNSNRKPRKQKYLLDFNNINNFIHYEIGIEK